MDERLKLTMEALEKALVETEARTAKIEEELTNPFLKTEMRSKHKKTIASYVEIAGKLKNQLRALKKLGDISSEELEELKNRR
jgi:hypothetical protein